MADLSDVLAGLREAVAAILYPNGVPAGATPPSVVGCPVRVRVTWPDASLDADLKLGIAWVTVWPRPGVTRVLSHYLSVRDRPGSPASLAASVSASGEAVTFTGTPAAAGSSMIAAVVVDRARSYAYPVPVGQGAAEVAAALAQMIAADRPATAAGGVLTLPGAFFVAARVVAGGATQRELRRQVQGLQLSVWAPSAALRDALARRIDDALLDQHRTLAMPDGTVATISYDGTGYDEEARQQPLFRRDLLLSAEYSNARITTVPGIAVPVGEIETDPAVIKRTILS